MNLRHTVEVAALISQCSQQLVESARPVPRSALDQTVLVARGLMEEWCTRLEELYAVAPTLKTDEELIEFWNGVGDLLEEMFCSEFLVRVWAAVITSWDAFHGMLHGEITARRLLLMFLEVRRDMLGLLLSRKPQAISRMRSADRLRRRIERWTDALLGPLTLDFPVTDFVFDVDRAREFGREERETTGSGSRAAVQSLILAGLRTGFPETRNSLERSARLNTELLQEVLGCLPPDMFERDGTVRSTRLTRLYRAAHRSDRPVASRLSRDGVVSGSHGEAECSEPSGPSLQEESERP